MRTHFSKLEVHRNYVLTLYRNTLRHIQNVQSGYLKYRTMKLICTEVKKHKDDKSSWSIYKRITSLQSLYNSLKANDPTKANTVLTEYRHSIKKPRSKIKGILKSIESEINTTSHFQDNKRLARLSLLDTYIKRKQSCNRLPKDIPQEYKTRLILPLALHERGLMNLERLKTSLMKGKYHTKLSYTMAGKTRIWFVRSYVNKKRKQSVKLRNLITYEKKKNLITLRRLEELQKNSYWAMHEAIWERYLDDGHLHKADLNRYMKNMQLQDKSTKQVPSVPNTHVSSRAVTKCMRLREWLLPLAKINVELENSCTATERKYLANKQKLLHRNSSLEYYKIQSQKVYNNHMKKYQKMLKDDLPFANPFIEERSVPEILRKSGLKIKF